MHNYNLSHLDQLEAEAIFILRETAAQFENPGLLFSAGKDSIVMAHLARKAFYPAKLPFPLVHVDTGHNFPETLTFRDAYAEKIGARLQVALVQESIERGTAVTSCLDCCNNSGELTLCSFETINDGTLFCGSHISHF